MNNKQCLMVAIMCLVAGPVFAGSKSIQVKRFAIAKPGKGVTEKILRKYLGNMRYLKPADIAADYKKGLKPHNWLISIINDINTAITGKRAFFVLKKRYWVGAKQFTEDVSRAMYDLMQIMRLRGQNCLTGINTYPSERQAAGTIDKRSLAAKIVLLIENKKYMTSALQKGEIRSIEKVLTGWKKLEETGNVNIGSL